MAVLDATGLSTLWSKIKSNFGHSIKATTVEQFDPYQSVTRDVPVIKMNNGDSESLTHVPLLADGGATVTVDDDGNLVFYAPEAGSVVCDIALSTTSTNAVQNKVINSALAAKAPLASPTFTGTPKAPTATAGTSTTQIATTAFVNAALPSAITATTTSSSTLSLSAGTITQVPLTTMTGAVQTNLSISSGGVKCAKAGYVRVSGSAYVSPASWESCNHGVYIKKGTAWSSSTEILSGWFYTAGYGGAVGAAPKIIYVSAGTIIWLAARCSVAGTCDRDNAGTYLTVEYVKQV